MDLGENYCCYIPSCDSAACVFLSGLVGRAHGWRAEGSGFESGPGKKKKKEKVLFLSYSYYCILISKDGCEKGRVTPRSWT